MDALSSPSPAESDGAQRREDRAMGLAVGSLVCGLVAILVAITAPIGLALGIIALRRPSPPDSSALLLAVVGVVLGGLGTLILVALLVAVLVLPNGR